MVIASRRAIACPVCLALISLHPTAAGRTYAAYSGVYMTAGLMWLWIVEGIRPDRWDIAGAGVIMAGAMLIFYGPRG